MCYNNVVTHNVGGRVYYDSALTQRVGCAMTMFLHRG